MAKIDLKIPMHNPGGVWEVEGAEQVGDLAVHRTRNGEKWTITHIPTLLGFLSIIPEEYQSNKSKLVRWATKIQTKLPKDWLAMRSFKHEDVMKNPESTKTVRGRVRAMALKTKV